MQVDYVDALLIHWPLPTPSAGNVDHQKFESSDPFCQLGSPTYSPKDCRISTWKGMLKILESGGARSVGVSNYKVSHLQEIIDAGLALPAINQCPFHIYRSSSQQPLIDFCRKHGIVFMGYSPLGIPDWWSFPPPLAAKQLQDPVVLQIAADVHRSPAEVLLNWQYQLGIPVQPRTQNMEHMHENLHVFDFHLTQSQLDALFSRPQDFCSIDKRMYQCVPTESHPNRFEGIA